MWKIQPASLVLLLIVIMVLAHRAAAQQDDMRKPAIATGDGNSTSVPPAKPVRAVEKTFATDSEPGSFRNAFSDLVQDQKQIWTSPSRLRMEDAAWLVPLGGIAAGLFVTDRQYSASLPASAANMSHYKTISNAGLASLVGAGAGMYVMSFPSHNEHWRETGFLAGEAALNSLIPIELMKYSLRRERPYQGDGAGAFFHGGTSFPSEHAAAAWSIAGVIAHEYPGVLPKLMAYGAATAIDISRVRGRQHFPADVFVGSALGYLIAQSVYNRHHEPELSGRTWESPGDFLRSDVAKSPAFMGSPYVPLDSWVYPALERLAALGYVQTAILGLRPWTRLECARLLGEASDRQSESDSSGAVRLYEVLAREFRDESELLGGEQNVHAQLESVYLRSTGISGKPLTDNQHFGQTILNDYGRPYEQGFNAVAGVSSWASWGPFVLYSRGEYQSAASAPAPPAAALGFIATIDNLPSNPPLTPIAAMNRVRLLDGYVGMNLANWQITFGKQSLWWGPGEQGAMVYTNNAEPLDKMFRISRVTPLHIPHFADLRAEFFLGQLAGQDFINNTQNTGTSTPTLGQYGRSLNPQPYLSGGKVSFKFTSNFEIGVSKTTIYGGPGNPLTPKTLFKSAFSLHQHGEALGDGRAGLDFAYRVPKLRDWLSVYGDAMQEDEISPLNRPYKSAFQTGLYLARVPKIPKLDLRLEGGTTSPVNFASCNGCYYSNGQYVSGYTNHGQLLGTWLGRAAQGEAFRGNYWLSPQRKIGFELRHRKVDRQYLPQGGTQNDAAVNADFFLSSGVRLSGTLQYEAWRIPLLAANRQNNVMASFGIGYWPRGRGR